MIKITKDDARFFRLDISGKLDGDDMRSGLDAYLEAVESVEKADFLYVIHDLAVPSPSAMAVEFTYIPQLLGTLTKLGKIAVVADQDWVRVIADIEAKILPGITMKTFEPGDDASAIDWLTSTSA